MILIATTGVAIEAISLGLLGVLYAVYAQFARPDEQGGRLPVVAQLRNTAWLVVTFAAFDAVTTIAAFWWLLRTYDLLFLMALILFFAEVALAPVLAAYLVFWLFR